MLCAIRRIDRLLGTNRYVCIESRLELLNPFVSVKTLYVEEEIGPPFAHMLQELAGERVMEILPVLHDLFLEGLQPSGPVQEVLKSFVAARQCSNHPVVIQRWEPMLEPRTGFQ